MRHTNSSGASNSGVASECFSALLHIPGVGGTSGCQCCSSRCLSELTVQQFHLTFLSLPQSIVVPRYARRALLRLLYPTTEDTFLQLLARDTFNFGRRKPVCTYYLHRIYSRSNGHDKRDVQASFKALASQLPSDLLFLGHTSKVIPTGLDQSLDHISYQHIFDQAI